MSEIRVGRCLALLAATLIACGAAPTPAQQEVHFTPTVGYPTFAVREPVLRISPGTVLYSETNSGPYYEPGGGAFPGEVGPFYIEGATTDDTLVIEIISVTPNSTTSPGRRSTTISAAWPPTAVFACSTSRWRRVATSGASISRR